MNLLRFSHILKKGLISCLLLCICATAVKAADQSSSITLKVENKTLKEALKSIEATAGYIFLYNEKSLDLNRKVSIDVRGASIDKVLQTILDPQTKYEVTDRQVVLYKHRKSEVQIPKQTPTPPRKISGVITDKNDEPLIGVTVIEKGTSNGVITDLDGRYSITITDEGEGTLTFSMLGYRTEEVAIPSRAVFNLTMDEDAVWLDDVVVIGYGTQTKATITGSLAVVDTKELVKAPVASITNVLAGSVPGISTVQTSGQPGSDAAQIYIRGAGSLTDENSAPLILVDGVERDFSQIDPNEIENFSVLKDAASTAVFGVRGANGVILITTKRGQEGKPSISFSSTTGIQQPMSYVKQVGSYEYATFWNQKMENDGITNPKSYFSTEAIEAYRTGSDPILYPNTNWGEEMFSKAFLQTKNNISISGGGKNIRYFVSLGYLFQNGLLKQNNTLDYNNNHSYNRYNYRANLDFDITKTTTLKIGVGGNVGKQRAPRFGGQNAGESNQWVFAYIWATPLAGPGFIDGKRTKVASDMLPSGIETKDGYDAFYGYGYDEKHTTTLNIDIELNQRLDFITEGLSLNVKGAYDNWFSLTKIRPIWTGLEYQKAYSASYLTDPNMSMSDPNYDRTPVYVPDTPIHSAGMGPYEQPMGYGEQSAGRDRNWYLEAKLHWTRSFGKSGAHKVSAMALYNMSRDYYTSAGGGSYGYIPRSYIGYVARATYSYKDKYLADVSLGYNGSENFAPGKTRYGLFPSASAGWVMSNEDFMKGQTILSYLKFRASWGKVGNDKTSSRFLYMPSSWSANGSYSFGIDNPNSLQSFGHGTPGNSAVTWETAVKQNYGIDIKFFRDRLSATVDYFTEHRTGILLKPNSVPGLIATSLPEMNIGIIDNGGYEVSLGWNDTRPNGFNYYINTNLSFARNKIIYMDEVQSQWWYQNQTGGPTGRYTGMYEFVRLYQESDFIINESGNKVLNPDLPQPEVTVYPGDAMYADLSKDGKVNSDDKRIDGYSTRPEYVLGLNGGFSYKGFNFSMQWTGSANVSRMFDIEYRIPFTNAGGRGLLSYFYEDCWSPKNSDGTLPRASKTSQSWNSENSTLWLRDASYLRLKTLTLGYTFNSPRLKAAGISSLGLSLSGYNLLTITGLDIIDPESVPNNMGAYPLVKVYTLGVNINF